MPLTDAQLAYVAGIVDGEGCISVHVVAGNQCVRLHVTNTDPRLIDMLYSWFGGHKRCDAHEYMKNAKSRYVWEINATKATTVLRLLLPYLFLKRDRAELAISIQATKSRHWGRVGVPTSVRTERDYLASRLSQLNRRGVS